MVSINQRYATREQPRMGLFQQARMVVEEARHQEPDEQGYITLKISGKTLDWRVAIAGLVNVAYATISRATAECIDQNQYSHDEKNDLIVKIALPHNAASLPVIGMKQELDQLRERILEKFKKATHDADEMTGKAIRRLHYKNPEECLHLLETISPLFTAHGFPNSCVPKEISSEQPNSNYGRHTIAINHDAFERFLQYERSIPQRGDKGRP